MNSIEILSDLIIWQKYARWLPEKNRRETWEEIVTRNKKMHLKKFPGLKQEIEDVYKLVYAKRIIPSARSLQFSGKPIELSPSRLFNCTYLAVNSWEAFHEIMFLLLGGSGVGFSIQRHHVEQLPAIQGPTKKRKRFLINDSIEGWADAVKVLIKSYFFGTSTIDFDFDDIRAKGSQLKTSGGRAPGPQPLKDCIHNLKKILDTKERGEKLTTLECYDMICFISDAVLAGGIRRSASIGIFSMDDEDMLCAKAGHWHELNPQRARANNSALLLRHRLRQKRFMEFWERIKCSGTGEPGFILSNSQEMGTNPCGEVSLKHPGVCNLTTINASLCSTQEELNMAARGAAFIGTLQAAYTDFHYLTDKWKEMADKEALLGVSICGSANKKFLKLDLREAGLCATLENERVAKLIGINKAMRITSTKPEGTLSLVLGTAAGIHPWFAPYFIRRLRINKAEPLYAYLKRALPNLIEDEYFKPHLEAVLSIPIQAPKGAILRDEGPIALLERVKRVYQDWIIPGHREGDNTHSISCTVSIKEDEWDKVGNWMWDNRQYYNCLSVLPYSGTEYKQMPLEEISQEKYEELVNQLRSIDLTKVNELADNTDLQGEISCSGGACQI